MSSIPFVALFPKQGEAETRTMTTIGYGQLPDDEYALVEAYCTDPSCDCQRVMLNVVGKQQMKEGYLAAISFGFNRDGEMAGPFLDPMNSQSKHAEMLLELVSNVLENDSAYVTRLKRHYQQVKTAVANPTGAISQKLARLQGKSGRTLPKSAKTKRKPRPKPNRPGKKNRKKRKRR